MIDEHGNPWGKWPYWINPLSYPVDKDVQETALYDWSGTRLNRNVTYMLPGKQSDYSGSVQTPIGNFSEYYLAIISPFNFQNLNATGSKEPVQVFQAVTYEPTTGLLLNSPSSHYLDDILAQKLARAAPSGETLPEAAGDVDMVTVQRGDKKKESRPQNIGSKAIAIPMTKSVAPVSIASPILSRAR